MIHRRVLRVSLWDSFMHMSRLKRELSFSTQKHANTGTVCVISVELFAEFLPICFDFLTFSAVFERDAWMVEEGRENPFDYAMTNVRRICIEFCESLSLHQRHAMVGPFSPMQPVTEFAAWVPIYDETGTLLYTHYSGTFLGIVDLAHNSDIHLESATHCTLRVSTFNPSSIDMNGGDTENISLSRTIALLLASMQHLTQLEIQHHWQRPYIFDSVRNDCDIFASLPDALCCTTDFATQNYAATMSTASCFSASTTLCTAMDACATESGNESTTIRLTRTLQRITHLSGIWCYFSDSDLRKIGPCFVNLQQLELHYCYGFSHEAYDTAVLPYIEPDYLPISHETARYYDEVIDPPKKNARYYFAGTSMTLDI